MPLSNTRTVCLPRVNDTHHRGLFRLARCDGDLTGLQINLDLPDVQAGILDSLERALQIFLPEGRLSPPPACTFHTLLLCYEAHIVAQPRCDSQCAIFGSAGVAGNDPQLHAPLDAQVPRAPVVRVMFPA